MNFLTIFPSMIDTYLQENNKNPFEISFSMVGVLSLILLFTVYIYRKIKK